jgi:hypothetical protein
VWFNRDEVGWYKGLCGDDGRNNRTRNDGCHQERILLFVDQAVRESKQGGNRSKG